MTPRAPHRLRCLAAAGFAVAGLAAELGCDRRGDVDVSGAGAQASRVETDEPRAIDASVARNALQDLGARVEGPSLLEVRIRAEGVSLVTQQGEALVRYVHDGSIRGPYPQRMQGEGALERNLFRFQDVAWDELLDLLPSARDAVDPDDGVVEEIVVRRYLPFEHDVRVRYFVKSPRMSGQFDASPTGKPLSPR